MGFSAEYALVIASHLENILQGSETAQEHLQDNFRRVNFKTPRKSVDLQNKKTKTNFYKIKVTNFVIGDKSLTGCFLKGKAERTTFRQ